MNTKRTFEPTVVGGIEVKNRIFRSATFESMAVDGEPGHKMYEMYENLSKGEVGLIITDYIGFSQTDHHSETAVILKNDTSIPGLKKLTDTVHQYGTKIVAQLNHTGSQLFSQPQGPAFGPSDFTDPFTGINATAFSQEQIQDFIKEFGGAASNAKSAGFDGVQIHGAHGYLLSKFLSPEFNHRTDEYGGSINKNSHIVSEIVNEIKNQCGRDFPVWIKLNSSDFHPQDQGVTEKDFLNIAEELSKIGIDAIEVSGGTMSGTYFPSRSKKHSAYHLESAKKLTEKINTSVILVGGLRNIDTIDSIISETKIDAVSMSRPLIREPDLVKKWMNGDRKKADCVACTGCFNPNGTQCFFTLNEEEKTQQRPIMKMMNSETN